MIEKILNEKYAIYSGIEIEQRKKKNKSADSHYFELFSKFRLVLKPEIKLQVKKHQNLENRLTLFIIHSLEIQNVV
jgi:hypothetical protein